MKNEKDIATRSWIIYSLLCVLGLAIMGKIFSIQFIKDEKWEKKAKNFTYVVKDINPSRGQIFSADGSLLATSVPEYDVYWDTQSEAIDEEFFKANLDSMALRFSQVFGDKSKREYKRFFEQAYTEGHRYKLIKRNLDYHKLNELRNFPFIRQGRFESGFIIEKEEVRTKPFGKLASRTIGINRDAGSVGIELAYDRELSGVKGQRLEEKIAGGIWRPMSDDYIVEPKEGMDIISSIDVHLQDVATHALERQLKKHDAKWGTVVLMEVETGYIKAISNLTKDDETGAYNEVFNLAIAQSNEPGSTFKLMSLMAALDDGLIELTDSVETGKGITYFHGIPMKDSNYDKGGNGKITVEEAFELSSNVGTAKLISKAYGANQQKFLDKLFRMGVHNPLGISIKGETTPKIYSKAGEGNWSGISLTQMSIGYELQQTPLQTLAYYNAIANDGKLVKPLFVQAMRESGGKIKEVKPVVLQESICSDETVEKCQKMLEGVVESGTAENAFNNNRYTVAGKTGTAKINAGGQYLDTRYRASFVGYFPTDNPRYSCIVMVSEPNLGIYYGSSISAPVFKDLADKIYATRFDLAEEMPDSTDYSRIPVSKSGSQKELASVFATLEIPTEVKAKSDWVTTSTKEDKVEITDRTIPQNLVPNVKGMGLQDALFLLESKGLEVKVIGSGTVKKQSIIPGARASNYKTITIELS
ncbi:penicillin-binding protein [Halocola ammonii]